MALNSGYLSNSSRRHHHGGMTTTLQTVSFLGLGEMGSALARAVIRAGHPTTVWNRSSDKAMALIDDGARAATTAAESIDAADLIVVCCSTTARCTRSSTRWPAGSPVAACST